MSTCAGQLNFKRPFHHTIYDLHSTSNVTPSPCPPSKRRCLSVAQLIEHSPVYTNNTNSDINISQSPLSYSNNNNNNNTKTPSTSSARSSIHSCSTTSQRDTNNNNIHKTSGIKNTITKPSINRSSSSTPDKFTKSRAVGQSHRDNEREYLSQLSSEVDQGRAENLLLYTLLYQHMEEKDITPENIEKNENENNNNNNNNNNSYEFKVHSNLNKDSPEDYNIMNDEMAEKYGLIKLTSVTAKRLGQTYISPILASSLMEIILSRRNLIQQQPDIHNNIYEKKKLRRRRSSYKYATTKQQINSILSYTINQLSLYQYQQNIHHHRDNINFIDKQLGCLGKLFYHFDHLEKFFSPESLQDDLLSPPSSPTTLHNSNFDSPHHFNANVLYEPFVNNQSHIRKRGEGAKRCSRCHKLKISGSGHGRSKCDDGYSISSMIPYPAPQKSDDHNS